MLNIQNLTFLQGGITLLQNVNLQAFANQRIGLVGKNGCGKSTLFRLIRGEARPDSGEVSMQSGKTVAFVEQEIANSDQPALGFVLDGDAELRLLEKTLARENHDTAWFDAQHRFEAIDGYGAKARAAQLLNGLGFASDTLERPVSSFSGGWRMRLNLARALMHRADLLLLDEPTNHLDLEAILWLEQYLARYPGCLILVSHDREFLNACVNRIAHLHDRTIDCYTGDYDGFERARAERIAQQNQAFNKQQEKIAHLEDFVRRFRAKATKAKQAQSRIKALDRLTRIAPAHVADGHFELEIEAPERSPDLLLRAEKMGFAYGDNAQTSHARSPHTNPLPEGEVANESLRESRGKVLFDNIELVLRAGARIALLGPNGAGKSTLIKLLTGELHPTSGKLEITPDIRIGYFAQHQLENLDGASTPLQHMERLAPKETTLALRSFLGRFGLAGDSEDRPVASFSGGEKSRLALALLAWQKPHLLLLDEPTNHLDLDMRDALTIALEEYAGAVVLVSHDRSLIRAVADELWLVADGEAKLFDGDLEDYKSWIETRRPREAATQAQPEKPRPQNAPKPNRKALQSKQTKLETALATAQSELAAVNRQLADPATYANPDRDRISLLNATHARLEAQVSELEESWLELEMTMEAGN
ncbi:MAG: ABC transporter ATP-binding protein [Gallionellales bacterium RIFCSPLOWO2_12_FULL_59_22]|nr:MAG: ABC transporter ATP-binding protein [Gallionellales bacterium RIFCSPLOWO2_02_FULL_59_110]OGT03841.1 MAG: ABC transporter ATP-binding protein [Gallionellales bacterium RIFCSPLOWO2_02_58_13]OGT12157.1 MAG: ABC transporter ATP-binding protein [Gallionellales bacterium RIFCSPLOWO2_12_FULL_59_22]